MPVIEHYSKEGKVATVRFSSHMPYCWFPTRVS